MARPIPEAPPVTTAVFPVRLSMVPTVREGALTDSTRRPRTLSGMSGYAQLMAELGDGETVRLDGAAGTEMERQNLEAIEAAFT